MLAHKMFVGRALEYRKTSDRSLVPHTGEGETPKASRGVGRSVGVPLLNRDGVWGGSIALSR